MILDKTHRMLQKLCRQFAETEFTKELLDTLAPGGNYIFSTDKTLLTLSDGTPENVITACEYIATHGKY